MSGDPPFELAASTISVLRARRTSGNGEFTITNLPQDKLIPELLALVKQLYIQGKGTKDQKQDEDAIEAAITAWIEEIKEEQIARERFDKIKDRFQSRWHGW